VISSSDRVRRRHGITFATTQEATYCTAALFATLLIILLLVTCSASDGTTKGVNGVDGEAIGLPSDEGPKGTPRVTGPVGETGEQRIAGLHRWCGRSRYRP
jgi:hypothetical protein